MGTDEQVCTVGAKLSVQKELRPLTKPFRPARAKLSQVDGRAGRGESSGL